MEKNEKNELFEKMPVSAAVAKLTIPTIISSLVVVIYNIADTYFVGLLNNPIQTAAVTLAAPALLAFNAVNNLFGVGTSSAMSRALGMEKPDRAKRCATFGLYCTLISAMMFSLLTGLFHTQLTYFLGADKDTFTATNAYIEWAITCGAVPSILNVVFAYLVRSEGASLHASIGTMSGCILNIILDPIFIMPWGLDMGAAGAGLATFLSNCIACTYFLVLIYKKRKTTLISLNPKLFHFDKKIAADIFSVGVPASIQNLLNVTGTTIFNNFAASYGSEVVAAMGVVQKIQMVPMQIALGASQGIMPFVGYNYAARNQKRMKESVLYVLKWMMPFLFLVVVTCILGSKVVVGFFIQSEAVIQYGSRFLTGFLLALPFLCLDFMAVGIFQAIGDGKKALLFAFLRKIVLEIPILILLNKWIPIYGMSYSSMCAEIIMAIFAVRMMIHILNSAGGSKEKPRMQK